MIKNKGIVFSEFSQFLQGLGYQDKSTDSAHVFQHPQEGLLLFRNYRENENVDGRDLMTTRKFLDMRGLLNSTDFDNFLNRLTTSA